MAGFINILVFLIPLISLILLINAQSQYDNSAASQSNNQVRNAYKTLPAEVQKNFALMLLTSFNKTSSEIDAACQQVLSGQTSANTICQGLKDIESKQQAAFQEFMNTLPEALKSAATQVYQNVIINPALTMGDKCTKFFEYANTLDSNNKMTLFKDMFKGRFGAGTQGNGMSGMSNFGNPANNMGGNSGLGNLFNGGMGQPNNSNGAQTSNGLSANPCNFIEHIMEHVAEKIQNGGMTVPSSS